MRSSLLSLVPVMLLASGAARSDDGSGVSIPSGCRHPHMLDLSSPHQTRSVDAFVSKEGDLCYGLYARAGQHFQVRITKGGDGLVALAVFKPGYTFQRHQDVEIIDGPHLKSAGLFDYATKAKAVLDRSGLWVIDFGLTNGGGADFTFEVGLK